MTKSTGDKTLDLLGVSELAELLSVSKQAISNWRSRERSFPQPVAELKSGPVWLRSEISEWAKAKGLELVDPPGNASAEVHRSQRQPAVTVAVVNMKGGVGKSTLTANLGWHFSYNLGFRVLLVDLDPQFNLSQYALGLERYKEVLAGTRPSVYDIFEQVTPRVGSKRKIESFASAIRSVERWSLTSYLDLLPSRLELAWTLKNPHHKNRQLAPFLAKQHDKYDLILIDCPPTESILTEAAYLSSDYILVPVKPDYLSTIGLPLLAESLNSFKKVYPDKKLQIAGIVFNAVVPNKTESRLAISDVQSVAKAQDWYVFKTMISSSESYPRGARSGTSIYQTGYARTEKILEFSEFSKELSRRIGL